MGTPATRTAATEPTRTHNVTTADGLGGDYRLEREYAYDTSGVRTLLYGPELDVSPSLKSGSGVPVLCLPCFTRNLPFIDPSSDRTLEVDSRWSERLGRPYIELN